MCVFRVFFNGFFVPSICHEFSAGGPAASQRNSLRGELQKLRAATQLGVPGMGVRQKMDGLFGLFHVKSQSINGYKWMMTQGLF